MSEKQTTKTLKVKFVYASGKKEEIEVSKVKNKVMGISANSIQKLNDALIYAFECALGDAADRDKDNVIVEFSI